MYGDTSTPQSGILADRLRARRQDSAPRHRRRQTDFGPLRPMDNHDDLYLAEAEAAANHKAPRADYANPADEITSGAGMRDLDQQLEKLTKESFSLKMELYYRRQREERLNDKVEAMAAQIARFKKVQEEHAELLRLNDQLVKELEQRDMAIREAIDMILKLETDKAELEQRVADARLDAASATLINTPKVIPASPEDANLAASSRRVAQSSTLERVDKIPSFLDRNDGAQALRSAYLGSSNNLRTAKSYLSMLSEAETEPYEYDDDNDETTDILDTPRLSLLSKFSELDKPPVPIKDNAVVLQTALQTSAQTVQYRGPSASSPRQDSIKRVDKWMGDTEYIQSVSSTPTKAPSPHKQRTHRSRTIDSILSTTPEQLFSSDMILNAPPHVSRTHPQTGHVRQLSDSTATGQGDSGQWYEASGSISMGTPSRFMDERPSRSRPGEQCATTALPTLTPPKSNLPVMTTSPPTMRPNSHHGYVNTSHVQTYIPQKPEEARVSTAPAAISTAAKQQQQQSTRHVPRAEDPRPTSPSTTRKTGVLGFFGNNKLFHKRRFSDAGHHVESPSSTRSSYLSAATSSVKNRPSTTTTSLSSNQTTSSREAIRHPTLTAAKPLPRSDSRNVGIPVDPADIHDQSTLQVDSTDEDMSKEARRRSGLSFTTTASASQQFYTPSKSAGPDLSRHGAQAAWVAGGAGGGVGTTVGQSPAPLSASVGRSTSTRGQMSRLLGFERRMSKA